MVILSILYKKYRFKARVLYRKRIAKHMFKTFGTGYYFNQQHPGAARLDHHGGFAAYSTTG